MMRDDLVKTIEAARQSEAFRNYLQVRDRVLDMLEQEYSQANRPSDYWEEELAGFDYMLDASPLIVQKLREHCYHLTGLRSYEYRGHHAHQREAFERKLRALQQQDEDNLLVPESPLLGGFGHAIAGALFNIDTLKYYECLVALNKAGLLASFRSDVGERKVVLEIGAGWGGFAYQFKTLCPNTCYIIIDLPQTLLFSGVYLKALFPHASVLLYGDQPTDKLLDGYQSYDFIFLPNFFVREMQLSRLDLVINMVSFQEMTSEQVSQYVQKAHELGCPSLYSLNRDRSPHNQQLTTVSSILARYYDLAEVTVLDIPYRSMTPAKPSRSVQQAIKTLARRLLGRRQKRSVYDYRHLIGTRKGQPDETSGRAVMV